MKLKILFFVLLCATVNLNAQGDKAKWAKFLGGDLEVGGPELEFTEAAQFNNVVRDGDFIIVNGWYDFVACWNGEILPYSEGKNGIVSKLDLDGNVIWTTITTGSGFPAGFYEIAVDNNGDIIAVGHHFSEDEFFINGEQVSEASIELFVRAYVAKFSGEDGSLIWYQEGKADGTLAISRLTIDEENNIYGLGYYGSGWECEEFTIGGTTVPLLEGSNYNIFYFKMNTEDGTCDWVKTWGNPDPDTHCILNPRSIDIKNGNIYMGFSVLGTILINEERYTGDQLGILKIDAENGAISKHIFFGGDEGAQNLAHLRIDQDGNVAASGFFTSSSNFRIGEFTLQGNTQAILMRAFEDGFVAKFDANLNPIWANSIGGAYTDRAFNLEITPNGYISIAGGFDPDAPIMYNGKAITSRVSTGLSMFQLFVDKDGTFKDIFTLFVGDGYSVFTNSMTVTHPSGRTYTAGNWAGDANILDPTGIMESSDHEKGFIMEWDRQLTTSIKDINVGNASVSVYPNPFVDELTVNVNEESTVDVEINDLTGRLVYSSNFNNNQTINLSSLNKGIYILTVKGQNVESTTKIIKK